MLRLCMMMTTATRDVTGRLRRPHSEQEKFRVSPAPRKVIRAGRRGGKTVGIAIKAIERFLKGGRVLYAAPTGEQTDRFWYEVNRALDGAVRAGFFWGNENPRGISLARP